MIYESFFGLQEPPFSIAPDPRYLYLTRKHRKALHHISFGATSNGGLVLLTGEIGAGKTLICRFFLEKPPENTDVAYIFAPKIEPLELLEKICGELGILDLSDPYSKQSRDDNWHINRYFDLIHNTLLAAHAQGRNTVLLVDEAQGLSNDLFEILRLLTNLETRDSKLLQIFLVGQPELRDRLALPEMQQIAQRITARFHLDTLEKNEVSAYVSHRLRVAGASREIFTESAYETIWQVSEGVPRLINIICDRALLDAYEIKKQNVDAWNVECAAKEALGRELPEVTTKSWPQRLKWPVLAACVLLLAIGGTYLVDLMVNKPRNLPVIGSVAIETARPYTPTEQRQNSEPLNRPEPGNEPLSAPGESTSEEFSERPVENQAPTDIASAESGPGLVELQIPASIREAVLPPSIISIPAGQSELRGPVPGQPLAEADITPADQTPEESSIVDRAPEDTEPFPPEASLNTAADQYITETYTAPAEQSSEASSNLDSNLDETEPASRAASLDVTDRSKVSTFSEAKIKFFGSGANLEIELVGFPDNLSDEQLEQTAYEALFDRWGIRFPFSAGTEPCEFAGTLGLGCMQEKGFFTALKLMDRPAILTFHDKTGRRYPGTLLQIEDGKATLSVGGIPVAIRTSELNSRWHDQFLALFKSPPGYSFPFKVGRKGDIVRWLSSVLGEELSGEREPVYTVEMANKVKEIQRNANLYPDGVVGPMTIIAINKSLGTKAPLLSSTGAE